MLTGILGTIVGATVPLTLALPSFWIFAVIGVGLSIVDVRCRRLPHGLTVVLWISSGVFFGATAIDSGSAEPLVRAFIAGIITAVGLLLIALALPGQLGLGDVHLAGAIAMSLGWMGWRSVVIGLLAGLLFQSAISVLVRLWKRAEALTPMGPALVAGWLVAIVFCG